MSYNKVLPSRTTWVFVRNLPLNTSDEELSQFLNAHGLPIPPDNITDPHNPGFESRLGAASKIIAVPHELLATLVEWVVNGDPFNGRQLSFAVSKPKR